MSPPWTVGWLSLYSTHAFSFFHSFFLFLSLALFLSITHSFSFHHSLFLFLYCSLAITHSIYFYLYHSLSPFLSLHSLSFFLSHSRTHHSPLLSLHSLTNLPFFLTLSLSFSRSPSILHSRTLSPLLSETVFLDNSWGSILRQLLRQYSYTTPVAVFVDNSLRYALRRYYQTTRW